jgi:hypothetical protein
VPEPTLVDQPRRADSKTSFLGVLPKRPDPKATLIGAVARLYWMLAGNAVVYLLALAIAQQEHQPTSTTDVVFGAAVVSLILRYLDITRLGGATAAAEPASLGEWYRYVVWLLLLSLTVWIIARAVAWSGFL